jgi:hypothetical protein
MDRPNFVNFKKRIKKNAENDYFKTDVRTKLLSIPVQYILSGWKVVQMTQPEFVDSQVYFDALVLKYLSY